ncbi:lipocalin family protein [Gaetbulibacter sp. M240]|uniref:lipocalin family protein n=1 Tax=Gaetbulibacter sp. M240 TaxID=3126511 RepID=UPI00374EA8D7
MKNLHQLLKALLFIFLLTGCSKSDEQAVIDQVEDNKFVGSWEPIKFVTACASEINYEENYSTCEQKGILEVKANGTFSQSYFYEYNNVCEEDGISSGTWKIVDDKLFVIEEGFGETEITYFEIVDDILRVGQYDTDFCDPETMGVNITNSYFYSEFQKK